MIPAPLPSSFQGVILPSVHHDLSEPTSRYSAPQWSTHCSNYYFLEASHIDEELCGLPDLPFQAPLSASFPAQVGHSGLNLPESYCGASSASPSQLLSGSRPRKTGKSSSIKKEMCKNWVEKGTCSYGSKCRFAHGEADLVQDTHQDSRYKSKHCKRFTELGMCPYGSRCLFIHDQSPKKKAPKEPLIQTMAAQRTTTDSATLYHRK